MQKRFIAPLPLRGCNADVSNAWLVQVLLPQIPRGTTLVMDNATFHKTSKTKELIEAAVSHHLFLPPYSPDLNPIEHCWYTLRSKLRALLPYDQSNLENLVSSP